MTYSNTTKIDKNINLIYIVTIQVCYQVMVHFNLTIALLVTLIGLFGGIIPYIQRSKCFLVVLYRSFACNKNLIKRVYSKPTQLLVYLLVINFLFVIYLLVSKFILIFVR